MGALLRDAFVRFEECHTAWLNEQEFVELARTLKAMARDLGVPTDPVINELVHFGAEAAFALLSIQVETESGRDFVRASSDRPAKPASVPLIH
ncbi:hypothetical protein HT136_05615 [Novosphingobium profundi]|uniref:hypothetical protein n=1 Tax=Novosphingobium profundi TaxID=1774954 RepID=UPI001BDAB699|nr:hypothetical protein [Novosphingobium profundi]MBT0667842.1 hypothetical protein [Novosphingobium profundi]